SPAKVDQYVLALDVAEVTQTSAKALQSAFYSRGRRRTQESDACDFRGLLRARRERPRGRRASKNGDEFPPPHGYPKAKDHGRSIAGVRVGQWRASQQKSSASTNGNVTTFRDHSGRMTATAERMRDGSVQYRDAMGRLTGSATAPRR